MKTILVLFSFFLFTNTYAQISTIPNTETAFDPPVFFPIPGGGYISLKKTYLKKAPFNSNAIVFALAIVKYDKDMNVVMEQPLSDGEKGFAGYYASIKESGNNFWIIYIERFKVATKSSFTNVIARKIDIATLQTGENKIVADENSIDKKINGYIMDYLKIMLESSPDKKHHVLYINDGEGKFYISSLNENFETVWQDKQLIPGANQYNTTTVFPDNEGNIFFYSLTKKDVAIISRYTSKGIATHNTSVAESTNIFDARFYADEATGRILVAGTCKKDSKNITDVFKSVLNKNSLQLENIEATRIPEEIISTLKSNGFGSGKSNKYGLYPSLFRSKICGNKDNGMGLIIECKDAILDHGVYITGNLIYVNFSSAKTIFSNIPRYTLVTVPNENGHYVNSFCKKNQVLVYFDNPENLNRSLTETPANFKWGKNAILVAAFIAPDGSITRKQVPVNYTLGDWQSVNKFLAAECNF